MESSEQNEIMNILMVEKFEKKYAFAAQNLRPEMNTMKLSSICNI